MYSKTSFLLDTYKSGLVLGNIDDWKSYNQCKHFFFCLFLSVIRRKLGFLGKEGYDIFGNNKMFAPRIKWQSLEDTVGHIKNAAESYEIAFNNIMSVENSSQDYKQVSLPYHRNRPIRLTQC